MAGASNGARRESAVPSPAPQANTTAVKVVVRIRPSTGADTANVPARFQRTAVQPLSDTSLQADNPGPAAGGGAASHAGAAIADTAGATKHGKQTFTYDRVISPDEGQADLYEAARPLLDSFLDGMNATILAYGQSGSGKSYSMGTDRPPEGVPSDGITPRAVAEIFDRLAATQRDSRGGFSFEAKVSYIEIYNEELIDLLAGDAGVRPTVQIREDKGGHILVQGIREVKVTTAEQVMDLLAQGSTLRQTGATGMNAQSSRSHAIFSLTVTRRKWAGSGPPPAAPSTPSSPQNRRMSALPRIASPAPPGRSGTPTADRPASRFGLRPPSSLGRPSTPSASSSADDGEGSWTIVTSKLHLVDLAGSERLKRTAAAGDRAKEGISINAGLSALGNVISALGDPSKKATHIPYRDSKLTRLLQDSLGGNARTMMVACVSPAEFNLNETLNTLRYANRARNIKNRAEVNEVEQGWDDVEYLQRTILKLRGELTAIKAGDGAALARRSVDLTSTAGGPAEAELQQKIAQLTAELAVAQSALPGSPTTPSTPLSRDQFAAAVEPIVEEYERSLSALESQLALTRAALGHSEDEMRELEARIEEEQQASDANAALVDELRLRVAKLSEREATTEAYVRDLEARLRDVDDADETHGAAVGELRKELSRNREQASSTELYIKELEARLASADEGNAALRRQIDGLERDIARREEAHRDLEARVQLLDTSTDSKQLLAEIDEKDRRLVELERELDALKAQAGGAADEAARLQKLAQEEKAQKEELQSRVRTLENGQARTLVVTPPRTPAERSGGDVDPLEAKEPASTAAADEQAALVKALQAQVAQLQLAHDETAVEFESAKTKYAESLREIEDLNAQVQEGRLLRSQASMSDLSDGGVSPASSRFRDGRRRSPDDDDEEDDEIEELSTTATTPAVNGSRNGSPTSLRTSGPRTPHARRSMPLSPQHRLSFLGRGQGAVSPSHLRSASLSQELSLAASSQTSCPTSPRPVSPSPSSHARRESFFGPSSTSPSSSGGERSYEQMKSEVLKLQSALDARDAEISDLEATVQQLRTPAITPSSDSHALSFPIITERAATPPPSSPHTADLLLSPRTRAAFDALKSSVGGADSPTPGLGLTTAPAAEDDEALAASRLDDLMRSMAQKESAHREAVDRLEDELAQLRRQHDELTVLSRTQVENMSAEIEQLRRALEERPERGALDAEMERLKGEARSKAEELQEARTAHEHELEQVKAALLDGAHEHQRSLESTIEDHSASIERIREEHAAALSQAATERDDAVSRALADAVTQRDELVRSKEAEHAAALQAQADALAAETAQQVVALEAQISHLEAELVAHSASVDEEHAAALARLQTEHDETLVAAALEREAQAKEAAEAHAAQLDALRAEHAAAVDKLHAEHAAAIDAPRAAHAAALDGLRAEHASALDALSAEHASALEQLRSAHAAELDVLRASHDEALAARSATSTDDAERERASLVAAHVAALDALRAEHASALEQRDSAHVVERDALRSSHDEALTAHTANSVDEAERERASLAAAHAAALDALRAEHASTLEARGGAHAAELDALRSSHSEALAAHSASSADEAERERAELVAAHSVALEQLDSTHAASLEERDAAHATELAALRASHADELVTRSSGDAEQVEQARLALVGKHADALEAVKREHSDAVDALKREHNDAIERARLELAAAAEKHVEEKEALRASLVEEHEKAVLELRAEHEQTLQETKQAHATAVDDLRSSLAAEHATAPDALKQDHYAALDNLRSSLTAKHSTAVDTLEQEHAAALHALRSEHTAALERHEVERASTVSALESSHAEELAAAAQAARAELEAEHAQALEALKREHEEQVERVRAEVASEQAAARARLAEEHEAALAKLRAEHERVVEETKQGHASALDTLRASLANEHSAAVNALQQEHAAALDSLHSEHAGAVERLRADHAATADVSQTKHAEELEQASASLREELAAVEAERDALTADLGHLRDELVANKATLSTLAAERDGLAERLDSLAAQHTKLVADHAKEVNSLRQSLKVQQQAPAVSSAASNELQETLTALSRLEKALHESQDERERLLAEVGELRGSAQPSNRSSYERMFKDLETYRSSVTRLDSRLVQTRKERDSLSAQLARMSLSSASAAPLGLGIRTQSPQVGGPMSPTMDAMSPFSAASSRAMSPSSELDRATSPPLRSERFLSNGSTFSGKAPPPTPPPSVPPPPAPLPTAPLPPVPQQSPLRPGARRSSNSSVTTMSEHRRGSLGGETTATSVRDSQGVDARVLKEQETQLARLKQQLAQREAEYQSQVDLANTLESALNDSERNLRKARLQSNEYARERDQYKDAAERLRLEAQDSHSTSEGYRQSVLDMEERLQEQRNREARAERARQDLEARMAEVNRRKSKFACF
ncbi:hypothetical protein JCM10450v2_001735 [Rhodotorula kratochvilovae]